MRKQSKAQGDGNQELLHRERMVRKGEAVLIQQAGQGAGWGQASLESSGSSQTVLQLAGIQLEQALGASPWSACIARDVFPSQQEIFCGNKLKEFCFPSSTGLLLGVWGGTLGAGNGGWEGNPIQVVLGRVGQCGRDAALLGTAGSHWEPVWLLQHWMATGAFCVELSCPAFIPGQQLLPSPMESPPKVQSLAGLREFSWPGIEGLGKLELLSLWE